MDTFTYNGLSFVKRKTLVSDETKGYFKSMKAGFLLMDLNREPKAFVCTNDSTPFVVTASKPEGGKTRYMYSTTKQTEQFLNIENKSHTERYDIAKKAVDGYM